jgi:hypothetical protein
MKPELNSDFQKMGELQSAFFSRERRTEGVALLSDISLTVREVGSLLI